MFILPSNKQALVSVKILDSLGFEIHSDGWTFISSDEAVAIIDCNGVITPVSPGQATINVTADAVPGEGLITIADKLEVQVKAAQAMCLELSAKLL